MTKRNRKHTCLWHFCLPKLVRALSSFRNWITSLVISWLFHANRGVNQLFVYIMSAVYGHKLLTFLFLFQAWIIFKIQIWWISCKERLQGSWLCWNFVSAVKKAEKKTQKRTQKWTHSDTNTMIHYGKKTYLNFGHNYG